MPDLRNPVALSVAGSDSGAGAGIQADLKTFSALGVFGCTVLTLITAQSTSSVDAVHVLPAELLRQQLETVFSDFEIAAMKSGAIASAELITALAEFLVCRPARPAYVLDPVMVSKHGFRLLADDAGEALRTRLIPLATVITPNLHEAAALLADGEIDSAEAMLDSAHELLKLGCGAVLLKGGHSSGAPDDLLLERGAEPLWLPGERVETIHTHGTGCSFSAAITAGLVRGLSLADAAREAKSFIAGAIRHAQVFGRGINPVNHFWQQDPEFGTSVK